MTFRTKAVIWHTVGVFFQHITLWYLANKDYVMSANNDGSTDDRRSPFFAWTIKDVDDTSVIKVAQ